MEVKNFDINKLKKEAMEEWEDVLCYEDYSEDPDSMYFRYLCNIHQLENFVPQGYLESYAFVVGPANPERAIVKVIYSKEEYVPKPTMRLHEVAEKMCGFFTGKIWWANQGGDFYSDYVALDGPLGEYSESVGVNLFEFDVYGKASIIEETQEFSKVQIDFKIDNFRFYD